MINKCPFCIYVTDVKCNMLRHVYAKHNIEINENKGCENNGQNVIFRGQNVIPPRQNVIPCRQNVIPCRQNVIPQLICKKCNKVYKTKKRLENHEIGCKGVDELTCPKCMISFTNRHNKARHIKSNKCKARSVIYAREPNTRNIIHTQNNNCIQNNIQTQNIINNNITINSFGNERLDHITQEDIIKILLSGSNTIPKYIKRKHFDKDFPENNNIIYTKENKCKVLENNNWREKDINLLSSKLIKDNAQILLLYCDNNEFTLCNEIKDEDIYKHVKDKLVIIYNKTDNEKYNNVMYSIKELVKNANQI